MLRLLVEVPEFRQDGIPPIDPAWQAVYLLPGAAVIWRRHGLSLLEITIAVMILGMALAPLVLHFKEARRQSYDARNLLFATTAATGAIDQLRLDLLRLKGAVPPCPQKKIVQGGTSFTLTPSVNLVASAAYLNAKVEWLLPGTPGKSHSIQLSSMVFLDR